MITAKMMAAMITSIMTLGDELLRMLRKDRGFTVAVVVLRVWCSRLTGD